MMNKERTIVLLEKAHSILENVLLAHLSPDRGDPDVECPLCMGELITQDDIELIDFIKNHLKTYNEA
jgi:hypothetical protein